MSEIALKIAGLDKQYRLRENSGSKSFLGLACFRRVDDILADVL